MKKQDKVLVEVEGGEHGDYEYVAVVDEINEAGDRLTLESLEGERCELKKSFDGWRQVPCPGSDAYATFSLRVLKDERFKLEAYTVHRDLSSSLEKIDKALSEAVKALIDGNELESAQEALGTLSEFRALVESLGDLQPLWHTYGIIEDLRSDLETAIATSDYHGAEDLTEDLEIAQRDLREAVQAVESKVLQAQRYTHKTFLRELPVILDTRPTTSVGVRYLAEIAETLT